METQLNKPKRDITILKEYHFNFIFPVQCCALNLIGHVAWPHVNLHSSSHFLPHHKQFPWFCLLKDAFITMYMLTILFPFSFLNSNSYSLKLLCNTSLWYNYMALLARGTFVWARESPDISYTLAISPSPSISAGTQATLLPEDTLLAGVVTLPAER